MIKNTVFLCSLFLALAVAATSCEEIAEPVDPIQERQLPESIRAAAATVTDGNNRFALDLYQVLRKEEGNLFYSPFSVSTAFAMTYAGARGNTETEMAEVFHFTLGQEGLHPAFGALIASLDTGAGFDGYRLNVANRLWGQIGFDMLPEYLGVTREHYGAELAQLDFNASEAARQTINSWVLDKTAGKIEDLIPAGVLNQYTRLVLTNAIYFKGLWLSQFDEDETEDGDFHIDPLLTVSVPTMQQRGEFSLGRAEGLQILELLYQTEDLSMIFILPDETEGLSGVEDRLSLENLRAWMETMETTEVDIRIPRFRVESEFSLKQSLAGMGMPSAFDEQADFSGINGLKNLYIQDALHKGYVEVNEEGTEAAGATGVVVGVVSMPPMFWADHPFLILIWDRVTESILFMGRVVNPAA
jgi:serpin B